MEHEPRSVLHAHSPENASWSSINLAEAVPGVMTPLCASVWVPASEAGLRAPFHAMGVLATSQLAIPADPTARITNAFFGRMAVRVDFLCEIGDLVPGQSGEALARDFFGFVPPSYAPHPSLRRVPFILARYPRTLLTIARRMERQRAETEGWWRREIARLPGLDLAGIQQVAGEATRRFAENLATQAVVSACAIQLVQEQLDTLAAAAGVDAAALLRGEKHEESVVLGDLWTVSRGAMTLEEFLGAHGYHGPGEGEVATRVWREDPEPVRRLVAQYAAKPDHEGPDTGAERHRSERDEAERTLVAHGGLRARLVLRMARRFIPLRGVGKVSYLQSIDVLRAAARQLGDRLTAAGTLAASEDAFYLTLDELTDNGIVIRCDLRDLVSSRRATRERFEALTVPTAWTGQAEPAPAAEISPTASVEGIGACAGIVEGRVVVVLDPSTTDVEEGDILVARTTDPAWVSLIFLSAALVVDIGGLMSHAAVVARELDIPCVMNTGQGTRVLRTGDLVRVDGQAGTVTVLERAGAADETPPPLIEGAPA